MTVAPPTSASSHSPVAQRLRGEVQRNQRRAARGIDRQRRALEAERVSDAPRRDRGRAADRNITLERAPAEPSNRLP